MHGTTSPRGAAGPAAEAGSLSIAAGCSRRAAGAAIEDGTSALDSARCSSRSRSRRACDNHGSCVHRARPGLRHDDAANRRGWRLRSCGTCGRSLGDRRRGCRRRGSNGRGGRWGWNGRTRHYDRSGGRARSNGWPGGGSNDRAGRSAPGNRARGGFRNDRRGRHNLRGLARLRHNAPRRRARLRMRWCSRGGDGSRRSGTGRCRQLGRSRSRCRGLWRRRGHGRRGCRRSSRNRGCARRLRGRGRRRGGDHGALRAAFLLAFLLSFLDGAQYIARLRDLRQIDAGARLNLATRLLPAAAAAAAARQGSTNALCLVDLQRARVRFLLGHADHGQHVQNGFALYL